MGTVHAVTPIQHGKADGEVARIKVGDELTEGDFTEQELRDFIEGGSAVEIGSDRKYSVPPNPQADPGAADADTRLRDQLIAQSLSPEPAPGDQPAASDAVSSGASAAGTGTGDDAKTIGQVAAEGEKANAEASAAGGGGSEGQP